MNTRIVKVPPTEYQRGTAQVHVKLSSGWAHVDAFGPKWAFGSMQPAKVNWSAIGGTSPADAVLYAAAISTAAAVAVELEASCADQNIAIRTKGAGHAEACCCEGCRV